MDIHTGRPRLFPAVTIVAILFCLCIIPGQFWIAQLLPNASGLVRIDPSLVFLDIPISLPVSIDLLSVTGLFFLVYPIVVLLYPSRPGIAPGRQAAQRVRSAFTGLLCLLFCTLAGGLIYYYAQEHFSRSFRTGINSFGINIDVHLPYPGYETVRLRGSTIILICFIIGMWIFIRKIRKEPGKPKAVRLTPEQRMTPYERMLKEKQMKEKQNERPPAAAQPVISKQPPVMKQASLPNGHLSRTGLCSNQSITVCKPEAVGYMPMS